MEATNRAMARTIAALQSELDSVNSRREAEQEEYLEIYDLWVAREKKLKERIAELEKERK